jgi:hypothetical protein
MRVKTDTGLLMGVSRLTITKKWSGQEEEGLAGASLQVHLQPVVEAQLSVGE